MIALPDLGAEGSSVIKGSGLGRSRRARGTGPVAGTGAYYTGGWAILQNRVEKKENSLPKTAAAQACSVATTHVSAWFGRAQPVTSHVSAIRRRPRIALTCEVTGPSAPSEP